MWRELWWRAHWIAPNRIPAPHDDKDYQRVRDEESNEATRVAPEEQLRVNACWGMEVYGPDDSTDLYNALKSLGWSAGHGTGPGGALTWVQQQRAYGQGGDYNVGIVTRSGDRRPMWPNQNHAPLPADVDYLLIRLHQVVPAVTCAVVCFVLKNEAAVRYEAELNLDRRSWRERGERWVVSTCEPTHLKERAIGCARENFRRMVSKWFADILPGYFSRLSMPQRVPGAELLTTRSRDLFSRDPPTRILDWRWIIANVAPHDVWTSKDLPGLRLNIRRAHWPKEDEDYVTASVAVDLLPLDRVKLYGGSPGAVAAISHEALDGVLSYFAVSVFLREAARDLKLTREQLNLSKARGKTLPIIEKIQQFFDRNAGVPAVARELRDHAKEQGWFRHYCGTFTANPWRNGEDERGLDEQLRNRVHFAASALIDDESATREHFEQLSTILSVRESIRAQRKMERVALAALFVATLSLIMAIPNAWVERATEQLRSIQDRLVQATAVAPEGTERKGK